MNARAGLFVALLAASACKLDTTVFSGDAVKQYTIPATIIPDSLRREVQFTSGGNAIFGLWMSQPGSSPRITVVFSHGKGGNLEQAEEWEHAEMLWRSGFNVLTYDYRGFGKSAGRSEDETTLIADAKAALAFVLTQSGVSLSRTVSYGHSLGSAPAIGLAAATPGMRALIIESGFSNGQAMAQSANPIGFPVRWLLREPMMNTEKIKAIRSSVLILHGDDDIQIPVGQGRDLYAAANNPKRIEVVAGAGHTNVPEKMGFAAYAALLNAVTGAP
jgi:fermentation-respiration switch protein FrsA (DUF1100 family)